jgi:hypothetical protein
VLSPANNLQGETVSQELTLEKETTKLEKYLVKQGRKDFVEAMRNASASELDSKMLSLAKHREEIATTKSNDTELETAKEKKKDLEAPYREQLAMNKKLSRFVGLMMKEMGNE